MGTDDQPSAAPVVNRNKLREITTATVPGERLEFESETVLMHIADEFVDDLLGNACRLAKHRDSPTLEASDLLLYLEREHDITVPGYENLEDKIVRKPSTSNSQQPSTSVVDAHSRRMIQVQRASNSIPHPSSTNTATTTVGMQGFFPSSGSSMQFSNQAPFFHGPRR